MARLRSLRASLGWLLVSIAVPLAVAGAVLLAWQWHQQREQAIGHLREQARALRIAVDRELALDLAVLQALAASRDIDRQDWESFHAVAKQAAEARSGGWAMLIAPDGQNLINTMLPFGTPLPNLRELLSGRREVEWHGRALPLPDLAQFDEPLGTGEPAVSGLVYGPLSRRPVIATNVPVIRDGRVAYVLGLAYGAEYFNRLLGFDEHPDSAVRALIDGEGRLVARSRAPGNFIGRAAPAPFNAGLRGMPGEGVGEASTLEGVPAYFAYSRSLHSDWGVAIGMPKSAVLAPAWRALWAWLAVMLAAASVGVVFAVRLWHRLAVPLDGLARRARAMSEGSTTDPHEAVPASELVEVEALRKALHDAAESERERRRTEREREEAREELRLVNARLMEADQRKDEFLAMLSHELRNPLAAIRNVAAILNRDAGDAPPRARALNDILHRQTLQLSRIVDDLLDVARITHGSVHMRMAPVRLDQLAHRVGADARSLMDGRAHRFTVHAATETVVRGDEARLTQVIHNLLDNAAKYTPPGGAIDLTVGSEDGQAIVCVADTGLGIEPRLLPRVFDLFTQGTRTIDRSQGGLGIGLTLVKNIAEMHGGRVEARSGGPGRGSEVIVRLPLFASRPAPGSDAPRVHGRVCGRRVLVVEDNADTAETLAMLLRLEGNTVEIAVDGADGLAKANALRPDAVLLDIGLPSMSGQEVCRALRLQQWSSRLPIIALTGWGQNEDRRLSREAGFDGHLVKPVDPAELLRLLAELLAAPAAPPASRPVRG